MIVTTDTHVEGYRIASQLGLVRGVSASTMNLWEMYSVLLPFLRKFMVSPTERCERDYDLAVDRMLAQVATRGANAIVSVRIEQGHQPPVNNSTLALRHGSDDRTDRLRIGVLIERSESWRQQQWAE